MKTKIILSICIILSLGILGGCTSDAMDGSTNVNKEWYGSSLYNGSTKTGYETYTWVNGKVSEISRYDLGGTLVLKTVYTYDGSGKKISAELYNGLGTKTAYETNYSYSVTSETYYERFSSSTNTLLLKRSRTYGSNGLLTQENRDSSNAITWTSTVSYNSNGQRSTQEFSTIITNGSVQFNKTVYLYN